jgi:aspartate/methionine/tyrosine aminotransferase
MTASMNASLPSEAVYFDPGDEVIIHEPYFSPYKDQVLLADGVPVFLPTYEEDGFQIDVALLKEKGYSVN